MTTEHPNIEPEMPFEEETLIIPRHTDDVVILQQEIVQIMNNNNLPVHDHPVPQTLENDVQNVMDMIVSENSKAAYNNANIKFLVWLYHHPDSTRFLKPDVIPSLQMAHLRDLALGADNKGRNMQKAAKLAILSTRSLDSCPIKVDLITFDIFAQYVVSRRRDDNTFLSKSTYEGMRSALMHLFRSCSVAPASDLCDRLTQLIGGMKRTVARQRQENGDRLETGKSPLSFSAYKFLCEKLLESDDVNALFGHCFLTLEWSLMSRADSVTKTHLHHIQWRDDCLIIYFAHTKTDQEGLNMNEPWHIYANPLDPAVCPVLALGKYLFSHPELLLGDQVLFPGRFQYDRFMKLFKTLITTHKDDLIRLGVDADNLGSHSARKGSSTLCTTGCTVSPPYISICLRAGWALPGVQAKYLHYQEAGDQYVGRTVTGLNPLTADFSISPPYFETNGDVEKENRVSSLISSFIPTNTCNQMRTLMRSIIASILFHWEFLREKLHPTCRFRSSTIMMTDISEFRLIVKTCHPWTTTKQSPRITGVPPHVSLLCSMQQVLEGQSSLPDKVIEKMSRLMEEFVAQNGGLTPNQVLSVVRSELQTLVGRSSQSTNGTSIIADSNQNVTASRRLNAHYYNNLYHKLPQNFKFPSLTFGNLICRWFLPDYDAGVPAFRNLTTFDVKSVPRGRQILNEMKQLMSVVEEYGREANVWQTTGWTTENVTILLQTVKDHFHLPANDRGREMGRNVARRHEQVTWYTVYRTVMKTRRVANQSTTNAIEN